MSNLKMETPDCNCDDNCCQPPKQKLWKKIMFFIVILAALAIVTVKLTTGNAGNALNKNDTINAQQSAVIDSTGSNTCAKTCDPSKASSCCPQTKK